MTDIKVKFLLWLIIVLVVFIVIQLIMDAIKSEDEVIRIYKNLLKNKKAIPIKDAKWFDVKKITSPFGMRKNPITGKDEFHNGIDIALIEGTELTSLIDGIVLTAHYSDRGGNQIVIVDEKQKIRFGYAHLKDMKVKTGDKVKAGQVIGTSGKTGIATGPHLHFTVAYIGTLGQINFIDPLKFYNSLL